jgi:hypothetical protein
MTEKDFESGMLDTRRASELQTQDALPDEEEEEKQPEPESDGEDTDDEGNL